MSTLYEISKGWLGKSASTPTSTTCSVASMQPRKDIDRCAFGKKIQNHLLRDLARIGAYSFCRDAVIGCEDVHRLAERLGEIVAADCYKLRREIFQTAQASKWLRKRVEMACARASSISRSAAPYR